MKLSDMIISGIIKKGILYEARNCEVDFEIPLTVDSEEGTPIDKQITIRFKAEHMQLKLEKD